MHPKLRVLLQRPRALLEIARRGRNPESRHCPSCGGSPEPGVLDRRFGVMLLRRCSQCLLLYRTPTDTPVQSREFYQSDYTEETVTELPDLQTLEEMKSSDFFSKGNLSPYIDLIRRFYPEQSAKLVDYGCSWGYNTWKFARAGFITTGVEVSRPRCDFGRAHLDVETHYSADELASEYNVFFSSHVFEHVPSPRNSYREAKRLLGDHGGLFIVITPNGSDEFRKTRPTRWHELWGRKHPNFLDKRFWENLLGDVPHIIMSRSEDGSVLAPLESIDPGHLANPIRCDLSGEELIVVASLPALFR
jgi:2-polyprenyl-3-methyl-5-hydroxy-6-metoxy-1,4-benzoquinol methylase